MESTALATAQPQAIARPAAVNNVALSFSPEQVGLIKDLYAKGASDDEFRLFLQTAMHVGLDPFKGQICLIKFKDKDLGRDVFQPCIKIDGQRAKAEETGKYRGQTEPQWCGRDGVWVDVWLSNEPPAAARIGVYRSDFDKPIYAVARWASYAATYADGNPKAMWKKMPDVMLAKCAESLALRKAFPQILGGIYTDVEMEQAQNEKNITPRDRQPEPAQPKSPKNQLAEQQWRDDYLSRLERLWILAGKPADEWPAYITEKKLDIYPLDKMPAWINTFETAAVRTLRDQVEALIAELANYGVGDITVRTMIADENAGVFEVGELDIEGLAKTRDKLRSRVELLNAEKPAA